MNQKTSPCDERVLEARIRSQPGPRCPGWPLAWAKFVSPPGGSVAGLRFVTAPSCGGRPQLCQLHPPLALLRVVCLLSDVLAVRCEPVKQIGERHVPPPDISKSNLPHHAQFGCSVSATTRWICFSRARHVVPSSARRPQSPRSVLPQGYQRGPKSANISPKSPASECTNPVKFGKEGPVVVPLSTTFSEGGLIP